MQRKVAPVAATLLAALCCTAPALAGVQKDYVHAYWTVAHHVGHRQAGRNIHRAGLAPDGRPAHSADYRRALKRLNRIVAASVPAWSDTQVASWFDDSGATACAHAPDGVANLSLPCGARVPMQRVDGGPIVVVTVEDRGPYVGGRTWDLSPGAKADLGCSDICYVHTRR